MIAHSFKGSEFGPAQNLHGATYTVDVEFLTDDIQDRVNWVIDIGEASDLLQKVLSKYNYKNLDELFPDENTTTEFMCGHIHRDLCESLKTKANALKLPDSMRVTLFESHKAWASYINKID